MAHRESAASAVAVVRDSGGRIVGRTKLQKIACLLELAGFGEGFSFEYRHYGPYSEELVLATNLACSLKSLEEVEHQANWGGTYSIFRILDGTVAENSDRARLAQAAAQADAVELELAATAAFLAVHEVDDPWSETARRKPGKAAHGRLDKAKELYRNLKSIPTESSLPDIV
jgi:uncharacterized protein